MKTKLLIEEALNLLQTPGHEYMGTSLIHQKRCIAKIREALKSLQNNEHKVLNVCHCYIVGERPLDELLPGERVLVEMIENVTGPCPVCSGDKE